VHDETDVLPVAKPAVEIPSGQLAHDDELEEEAKDPGGQGEQDDDPARDEKDPDPQTWQLPLPGVEKEPGGHSCGHDASAVPGLEMEPAQPPAHTEHAEMLVWPGSDVVTPKGHREHDEAPGEDE
jgi:hypothetical protein